MKHIVVDLEMNAISKEYDVKGSTHKEIIEIGAVMLDEEYKEIDSFVTYVKPELNDEIEKRYESLTGISTSMVMDAPLFDEAIAMFADWCYKYDDEFMLYQWSECDKAQIAGEIKLKNHAVTKKEERLLGEWVDFQKEYSNLLGLSRPISLDKAIDFAGADFKGRQHDALSDARNTAYLFALSKDKARFDKALKYVIEALKSEENEATIGELIDFDALRNQLE